MGSHRRAIDNPRTERSLGAELSAPGRQKIVGAFDASLFLLGSGEHSRDLPVLTVPSGSFWNKISAGR
jgi:hypothetical protein